MAGATIAPSSAAIASTSTAAPLCATTDLRIAELDGGGAAGTRILTISYLNTTI
jgi:hypothetical protein